LHFGEMAAALPLQARLGAALSVANMTPQRRLTGRNSGEIGVECRENPMFEGITRYKVP
jgi:hypothetical protein